MESLMFEVLPFLLGVIIVYVSFLFVKRKFYAIDQTKRNEISKESLPGADEAENDKNTEVLVATKASGKPKKNVQAKSKDTYTHPWLFTTLKGSGGEILDMDISSNGKYVATCANDRSVFLWCTKTFGDKNHKFTRVNIEFDYATQIKFSPDPKFFLVSTATGNAVSLYRGTKKADGLLGGFENFLTLPQEHAAEIINIGVACNGKFLMTAAKDTSLVVWTKKGEKLASIDTLHINNYYACVSPCGRFVASSGFTPDVRVWEVVFKQDEFKEVKRAFELKGHSSGVPHFSFNNDSSRMVTASKDGTWKLWNTNIEYQKGQEPYLLRTCAHGLPPDCKTALSSDGRTIAISPNGSSDIFLFSGVNGELQGELTNITAEPLQSVQFSPDDKFVFACGGRHVRIFHNIPGYRNVILGCEEAKRFATSASTKERLEKQIEETRKTLKSLGHP